MALIVVVNREPEHISEVRRQQFQSRISFNIATTTKFENILLARFFLLST